MEKSKRFGHQIKLLSNAFEQAINKNCELSGLTGAQAFMMGYVVNHPETPIYAKTLEQEFHLKHPTVCGILQRLESKGLIKAETCTNDRRMRFVTITEKGLAIHRAMRENMRRNDRVISKGLCDAEMEQLNALLTRVLNNLNESENEETL